VVESKNLNLKNRGGNIFIDIDDDSSWVLMILYMNTNGGEGGSFGISGCDGNPGEGEY
jgi:hypothetical protein